MDAQGLGKLLIVLGAVVAIFGAVVYAGGGKLFSFFGRLPGDIRIEGEHTKVFIPITSMIVISIVLTLILTIISRLR